MSVCIQDNKQEKIKTNGNFYHNKLQENGKDLIVLSEDEDDPNVNVPAPKVEKENVDQETYDNQIKFINEIEKELKDEENALLLFKSLKSSQCVKPKAPTTPKVASANSPASVTATPLSNNKVTNQQKPNTNAPAAQNQTKLPVMKVTKQVALNAIEQQFSAKRSALKKHLERAFENIPLPSPGVNSGLAEIAFVPSSIATDFSSLIGLEEVCKNIQEYETQTNKLETKKVFSPFSCARCQTDFTPVWKREKPGSTGVVCENCLVGTHKTSLHKDFEVGIRNAISQYTTAEKELQKEYDELVNNPENLDKFIKEHEKKLTLAAAQQAASSRTKNSYGNSNNNNNLIYSNGNGSLHNSQQAQALAVASSLAAVANGSAGNNLTSSLNAEVLQSLSPIQQAQIIAHLQAQAQQQQQQQQLVASLAAAAASAKSNSSNNSAALSSLASSLVTQQQQAHQIQQQQLLATVIATIQQQQQQQQQAAALQQTDQMSQLQSVLSLLGGQNNHRSLSVQSSQQQQNRQQQLLQQTLLQYSLLQQQQQQQQQQAAAAQQVIVTQQSANMKNSSIAAATQQQQQQLALLQHILQQQSSNNNTSTTPSTTPVVAASVAAATASLASSANNGNNNANAVASLNLLQSLQSLGAAAIKK